MQTGDCLGDALQVQGKDPSQLNDSVQLAECEEAPAEEADAGTGPRGLDVPAVNTEVQVIVDFLCEGLSELVFGQ